jgi:UDP-N-acetylmuramoylalanine--D-glutamate ligase
MGLGHFGGGLGAAQWLAAQGAKVTVTDAAPADKLAESIKVLEASSPGSFTYHLGGHDLADLDHCDLLVVNPAVDRAKSAFVQAARAKRVPTTTEINLFLERCPACAIGITGSVGKSTTTALIHHALKAALHQPDEDTARASNSPITNYQLPITSAPRVFLGGNIGRSLLLELPNIRPQDLVVLELSSFMLEETPSVRSSRFSVPAGVQTPAPRSGWSPHIAVVTNIFPNHLDRHGTMEAYAAAKQNILRFQSPNDIAILNGDHEFISTWDHVSPGKIVKFHAPASTAKLDLVMPGMHNQSNAAAALAVLNALQIPLDGAAARAAIAQFPGLAHRLQCVHSALLPTASNGGRHVRCFNDSKATSPDASLTAIQTFDPGTAVFIVGGYDKHLADSAFEKFDRLLAQRALGVLGIGATGQAMIDRIQKHATHIRLADKSSHTPRLEYVGTLEHAVIRTREWTRDLPIQALVLSPASASWDQFPNYEKRGETFSDLARLHFASKICSK